MEDSSVQKPMSDSRKIMFFGNVKEDSVKEIVNNLLDLEQKDPIKDILLYIDTYGGEVDGAMAIHETINTISCRVAGICIGKAMSAGSFILMSCTQGLRFMSPNSRIMMHEMAGGSWGCFSYVDNEITELRRLQELWLKLTVKYTKMNTSEAKKLLQQNSSYLTAQEAVERGIVDEVLSSNSQLRKKVNI